MDLWVFFRKGKLGGSDAFIGRSGGVTPPTFLKMQGSWSKVGHAAIEMATLYSVTVYLLATV